MIYLDSAATSLWHPKEAEERMIQALRGCGNAGRGAHDATCLLYTSPSPRDA